MRRSAGGTLAEEELPQAKDGLSIPGLEINRSRRQARRTFRFPLAPEPGALRWREKPEWLQEEEAARRFLSRDGAAYRLLGPDSVLLIDQLAGRDRTTPWLRERSRRTLRRPFGPQRSGQRGFWPTLRSEEINPGGSLRPFGGH